MSPDPKQFSQLLSEGIHRIRIQENKKIGLIQDELGYALGRNGAHAINHWRRGNVPAQLDDLAVLARQIAIRGQVNQEWLEKFLTAGGHPSPGIVLRDLTFSSSSEETPGGSFLTRAYPRLVGRENDIRDILHTLRNLDGPRSVGIDGLGGIGKTSLAGEVVRRAIQGGAFDTTIWISAAASQPTDLIPPESRALTFEGVMNGIARKLGHPDPAALSPDDRIAWIRGELYRTRALIILDNLETAADPQNLIVERLTPLLQNHSRALLTSRQRFTGNVYPIHLTGLNDQEAEQFIRLVAEMRNVRQVAYAQATDFSSITRSAGGSPLALELITSQWGHLPLTTVLDHLEKVRPLALETQTDEYLALYRNIYARSWDLLTENGQNLLLALWYFVPGQGGTLEALSEVSAMDLEILPRHVHELWHLSLLESDPGSPQPRYFIHALTQHFIQSEIIKNS